MADLQYCSEKEFDDFQIMYKEYTNKNLDYICHSCQFVHALLTNVKTITNFNHIGTILEMYFSTFGMYKLYKYILHSNFFFFNKHCT